MGDVEPPADSSRWRIDVLLLYILSGGVVSGGVVRNCSLCDLVLELGQLVLLGHAVYTSLRRHLFLS